MKSKYKDPMVIAEIGCNHKGEMSIAKDLLNIASQCGVQVAKFQKRHNKELLTEEQYNAPHPNPINSSLFLAHMYNCFLLVPKHFSLITSE